MAESATIEEIASATPCEAYELDGGVCWETSPAYEGPNALTTNLASIDPTATVTDPSPIETPTSNSNTSPPTYADEPTSEPLVLTTVPAMSTTLEQPDYTNITEPIVSSTVMSPSSNVTQTETSFITEFTTLAPTRNTTSQPLEHTTTASFYYLPSGASLGFDETTPPDAQATKLSAGTISGIAVGGVAAIAILLGAAVFLLRCCKKRREKTRNLHGEPRVLTPSLTHFNEASGYIKKEATTTASGEGNNSSDTLLRKDHERMLLGDTGTNKHTSQVHELPNTIVPNGRPANPHNQTRIYKAYRPRAELEARSVGEAKIREPYQELDNGFGEIDGQAVHEAPDWPLRTPASSLHHPPDYG